MLPAMLLFSCNFTLVLHVAYPLEGLFWVPAGTFNIVAIRSVGMATSQAVVSSTIVMV